MKIVFFTSDFASINNYVLKKVKSDFTIDIITNKKFFYDEKNIEQLNKYDLGLVYKYGAVIPNKGLEKLLMINMHYSILPKYRGAAPIQSSLLNGDKFFGITWHKVVQELDAGPVFLQIKVKDDAENYYNAKQVFEYLDEINFKVLLNILNSKPLDRNLLFNEKVRFLYPKINNISVQDFFNYQNYKEQTGLASYTMWNKTFKKVQTLSFSKLSAKEIYNRVRAFNPEPGTSAYINFLGTKHKFIIKKAKIIKNMRLKPGQVMFRRKQGMFVGTMLHNILIIQGGLPDKKVLSDLQFLSLKGKITKFF